MGGRGRRILDALLAGLARLMVRVFFREIEVAGLERIPRNTPLLIAANHVNNVVDPLLLLGFLSARPRFLAKSTLFRHPVMGPLLALSAALPVYRRRDRGQDVSRNFETFGRCGEALARGGVIALFPEGMSHNLPHGLPLKTGAARIVLETEARHGGPGVRVVPVGLVYEAKDRFRSRVLVNVGEAIDPSEEASRYDAGERAAVRALTERIGRGLEAVTVGYRSWDEARLIDRAVALAGGLVAEAQEGTGLATRFSLRKVFLAGYRALLARDPARVEAVAEAVTRYDRTLQALSIPDEEVAGGKAPPDGTRRRAGGLLLPLRLPVVAAGTLLNWAPYRLAGWVSDRFTSTPDEPATYALLTSLFAFPLFWTLEIAAATFWRGPWWALAVAALAPVSGWSALRFFEERGRWEDGRMPLGHRLREWLLLDLRAQRETLRVQVAELVAEYGRSGEPRENG